MLLNWCWRRLLRVPWTARRSNQSILKEINPEYLLEELMPTDETETSTFATDTKSQLVRKDPDAGKAWRHEEKGTIEDEMVRWYHRLNGQVWVNSNSWWWTGRPSVLRFMGSQRVGHDWATELNLKYGFYFILLFCMLTRFTVCILILV